MIDKGGFYKAVLQVVREMQSERSGVSVYRPVKPTQDSVTHVAKMSHSA